MTTKQGLNHGDLDIARGVLAGLSDLPRRPKSAVDERIDRELRISYAAANVLRWERSVDIQIREFGKRDDGFGLLE